MATHAQDMHERSLKDLLKELRDESVYLFKQEIALAKTEMSEKASLAGRNAVYVGAGGFVVFTGAILLLHGVSIGLSMLLLEWGVDAEWSSWLGHLIVGAIVALVGYMMLQKGITTLKHETFVPERTVESLKEDKEWVKRKVS